MKAAMHVGYATAIKAMGNMDDIDLETRTAIYYRLKAVADETIDAIAEEIETVYA